MRFYRLALLNTASTLVASGLMFLVAVYIGRVFTVEEFGVYSYILRIATNASIIPITISMYVFTHGFRIKNNNRRLFFWVVFLILSTGSVLVSFPVYFFPEIILPDGFRNIEVVRIGVCVFILFVCRGIIAEGLTSLGRVEARLLIEVLILVIWLSGVFWLGSNSILTIDTAVLVPVIAVMIVLPFFLYVTHFYLKEAGGGNSIRKRALPIIVEKGKYFLYATSLNTGYFLTALFVLSQVSGENSLGVFFYIYYITVIVSLIGSGLARALLAGAAAGKGNKTQEMLWLSNHALLYSLVPIWALSCFFYKDLMVFIFNRSGVDSMEYLVFSAMFFYSLAKALASNAASVLNGMGRTKDNFRDVAKSYLLLLFILGALVFIDGLLASVVGLLVSTVCYLILLIRSLSRVEVKFMFFSPVAVFSKLFLVRGAL